MEDGGGVEMNERKILIINICKEKLHYFEFVKPIEDILRNEKREYFIKHYKRLRKEDLEKTDKIIICGTSLKDNEFLKDVENFRWIKNVDKEILGICGGMQVIGLVYGGKLKRQREIGFFKEKFKKRFLGLFGEEEVYHLHNYYVSFSKEFEIFAGNRIAEAVKHKKREIYAVLFYPEVRQKNLIRDFCLL